LRGFQSDHIDLQSKNGGKGTPVAGRALAAGECVLAVKHLDDTGQDA
jgi:hypothetical protein